MIKDLKEIYTITNRFVIDDKINATKQVEGWIVPDYANGEQNKEVLDIIKHRMSLGNKDLDQFYGTWAQRMSKPETLVHFDMMIHYLTVATYNEDRTLQLQILINKAFSPNNPTKIAPVITLNEVKAEIMRLVNTNSGLDSDVLNAIWKIWTDYQWDKKVLLNTVNKELSVMWAAKQPLIIPYLDADSILRCIVYAQTGKTLLIKDNNTLNALNSAPCALTMELLNNKDVCLKLATNFYRFKEIYLTLKKVVNHSAINFISKKAKQYHKPKPVGTILQLSTKILTETYAKKLDVWQIIKGLTYIYRRINQTQFLYKIRNGKEYFNNTPTVLSKLSKQTLNKNWKMLIKVLDDKLSDRYVLLDKWIHYAVPTSLKQLTSFIPSNSYIDLSNNKKTKLGKMPQIGIHWYNLSKYDRVDLDLSAWGLDGTVAWNIQLKDDNLIHSGDRTTAPLPDGAYEGIKVMPFEKSPTHFYSFQVVQFTGKATEFQVEIKDKDKVLSYAVPLHKQSKIIGCLYNHRFYITTRDSAYDHIVKEDANVIAIRKEDIEHTLMLEKLLPLLSHMHIIKTIDEAPKDATVIDLSSSNLKADSFAKLFEVK